MEQGCKDSMISLTFQQVSHYCSVFHQQAWRMASSVVRLANQFETAQWSLNPFDWAWHHQSFYDLSYPQSFSKLFLEICFRLSWCREKLHLSLHLGRPRVSQHMHNVPGMTLPSATFLTGQRGSGRCQRNFPTLRVDWNHVGQIGTFTVRSLTKSGESWIKGIQRDKVLIFKFQHPWKQLR